MPTVEMDVKLNLVHVQVLPRLQVQVQVQRRLLVNAMSWTMSVHLQTMTSTPSNLQTCLQVYSPPTEGRLKIRQELHLLT